jgi:hypothetical protein
VQSPYVLEGSRFDVGVEREKRESLGDQRIEGEGRGGLLVF